MANLRYTSGGFPSDLWPNLKEPSHLEVSWVEMVWAAITVGRESIYDVYGHGFESLLEIIYRSAMVRANLSSSRIEGFNKTDAYKDLDPSEKSAVSYFLGLSVAKLAAHRLFGIPWLIHLDRVPDCGKTLEGKSRPDLVGLDNAGKWCVFEAKGRTGPIDNDTIRRAREQTHGLTRIYGNAPSIRVAAISHFRNGGLELHLENSNGVDSVTDDPEIPDGENYFLRSYYGPFVSLIEYATSLFDETSTRRIEFEHEGNRKINAVELSALGLIVGMDSFVQEALKQGAREQDALNRDAGLRYRLAAQPKAIPEFQAEAQVGVSRFDGYASFLGPDGIFVGLGPSWDQVKQ